MTEKRARYDAAFKLEIAKMVIDQGLTVSQVVKDMNIGETAVQALG
jgi:transposase